MALAPGCRGSGPPEEGHVTLLNSTEPLLTHASTGFSSMLIEEGFRRAAPKPIHLEATTAKSRDIYARYGFEVRFASLRQAVRTV